ncbi:MAG: ATP-dependent sacrificial sulfur transferase LarE [Candidatus Methanofastidiosa archaeon]|nr:ATP-dependent sacrificial sulfur transferase LarE [Candidatus Methanofastidiosa archaeon]
MNPKYGLLVDHIRSMGRVAVAYSGGVDSNFLLKAAVDALGKDVIAITVISPYIPRWEVEEAQGITAEHGIEHRLLNIPITSEICRNPENRCYICKRMMFSMMVDLASGLGCDYVLDGTNLDDISDYRPGLLALSELGIMTPLLDLGIRKEEIREMSQELGLSTWDKSAYACLLSRIPYGQEVTLDDLERIGGAERYLMDNGFKWIRVRSHGDLARIEVRKDERYRLFNENLLDKIDLKLRELGFRYVTLDLQGYRRGSLNDAIESSEQEEVF